MVPVEIYTTMFCGYCHAAKRLLAERGIAFSEIDVTDDPPRREEMTRRAGGRRTVPQVFIGGRSVGGFNEVAALDRAGRLEALVRDAGQDARTG